jgi:hypothetical protein
LTPTNKKALIYSALIQIKVPRTGVEPAFRNFRQAGPYRHYQNHKLLKQKSPDLSELSMYPGRELNLPSETSGRQARTGITKIINF